jgi:hypothetical protein
LSLGFAAQPFAASKRGALSVRFKGMDDFGVRAAIALAAITVLLAVLLMLAQ